MGILYVGMYGCRDCMDGCMWRDVGMYGCMDVWMHVDILYVGMCRGCMDVGM